MPCKQQRYVLFLFSPSFFLADCLGDLKIIHISKSQQDDKTE